MRADLPEIPREAIDAVMDAIHRDDAQTVTDALRPAWPILYATALRHAARTLDERWSELLPITPAGMLRRMADEATP